jgi:hypothetical protein
MRILRIRLRISNTGFATVPAWPTPRFAPIQKRYSKDIFAWIVWTDLLFKRLENQRRQRKLYAAVTYMQLFV